MNTDSSVDSDHLMEEKQFGESSLDIDRSQIMFDPDSTHRETLMTTCEEISKLQEADEHCQLPQPLQSQYSPNHCVLVPIAETYDIFEEIGRGAYGIVHKGAHKTTGSTVAMKHIFFNQYKSKNGLPVSIIREIATLRELNHPNVVKLLDINQMQPLSYCLIFEYLAQDLKIFIDRSQTGINLAERHGLSPPIIKNFMKQILRGVAFCHSHRILHRDLKPGNLLISADGKTLKLADFGLARLCGLSSCSYTQEVVTLWYRAPELILGTEEYFSSVDVWSIGCIFAEMITGFPLFRGKSDIDQLFSIFEKRGTPNHNIWPGYSNLMHYNELFPQWNQRHISELVKLNLFGCMSSAAGDLLERLLQLDPSRRLACNQALKHCWFN